MENTVGKQNHKICLDKRSHLEICGVSEVVSFDDMSVLLLTDCGEMNIEGKELKIGVLDTERGLVELDGRVDAIFYSDDRKAKHGGLFSKRSK